MKSHASTNQLLETRYEGIWEKPRTGNAPEGSLLAQYAKFLDRNHIEKPLAPPLPGSDPEVGYVRNRLRKTHDLWHVITGFDTTVEGELGLQAVYLAQMEVRLSSILIGAGFLHTALFAPAEMHPLVRKIVEGWRIGQSASPLFGFKFEENWMRDLGEIRTSLGLPVGGVG